MKGRPLVETPGSGEAGADEAEEEEEEDDGFVGFQRHGMAVGRGRVPTAAAATPVLGTSPTAPGSAWSSVELEFHHHSQFLHPQPTSFSILLLRSERGQGDVSVFRSELRNHQSAITS